MGFESRIFISAEQFAMDSSPSPSRGATADGNSTPDLARSLSPTRVRNGGEAAVSLSSDSEDISETGLQPEELSQAQILHYFENPLLVCFQPLVAMLLAFWALLPILRDKTSPKILKKILGLITDEHKPPLPTEVSHQRPKKMFEPGSRYPHRYDKLLGILRKTGFMGFDLRNPANLAVGLLFGTLNPVLVSNLLDHLQTIDLTCEEVKSTLVFTLLFLSAVMRNTVLVKNPLMLYSFVQFLQANFHSNDEKFLDKLPRSDYNPDFIEALRIVGGKVYSDFKSIPKCTPLDESKLARFKKDMDEFALPDDADKTSASQKLSEPEIPKVLVEAYERHWFALQWILPQIVIVPIELFELTGDCSDQSYFFMFLTFLTSSCRKSSTIFQKEFQKVLRGFQDKKVDFFSEAFAIPASKTFTLIRLVFLEESDIFVDKFFAFDAQGKKCVKPDASLRDCLHQLLEKMHEIAEFSKPVHKSMQDQIDQVFPDDSVAAAGGGVCASKGFSFRPGNAKKSAFKQPSSAPATASVFTEAALREHNALQSKMARQLVTIGITTPDKSMALAAKFNEASVTDLKKDLNVLSRKDVIETLRSVSVSLNPLQLKKLLEHVNEE
jgi:hypothetical protein